MVAANDEVQYHRPREETISEAPIIEGLVIERGKKDRGKKTFASEKKRVTTFYFQFIFKLKT